ncbi:MAG: hypothetical protein D6743_09885 [Calditrichaeota bacterium]|nr:MAG: hypothetical protein D6743_09885 [Calditrichota bacterium]
MNEQKRHSRPRRRRFQQSRMENQNIRNLIEQIEDKLQDSIKPETVTGLNSFERKLIHRHFDHKPEFETRTYRNGDRFSLAVYPVGNIERFAMEKAEESLQSGAEVDLPPMGSYERYIVHNALKDIAGLETMSEGEGSERHVRIVSKRFGRGLKRIVKKIKLF